MLLVHLVEGCQSHRLVSCIYHRHWRYIYISVCLADFLKNKPNVISSQLSEKVSNGRFLKPKKLQKHSNEGKRKEKKSEEKERWIRKQAMVTLLVCKNTLLMRVPNPMRIHDCNVNLRKRSHAVLTTREKNLHKVVAQTILLAV